jgi:hypothetical protein
MRVFRSHQFRRGRSVVLPVRAALLVGVLLSTAACSSGAAPTAAPSGSAGPATPVVVGSLSELADRLGCTGLTPTSDPAYPVVHAQGTCTLAGETATLVLFHTAAELQTWSDSTPRASDVAAVLLGGAWAITFRTRVVGQTAQRRLGGRLV